MAPAYVNEAAVRQSLLALQHDCSNSAGFDKALVARAHRVCLACNSGAAGDEMQLVFRCTALASLRSRYASLFTGSTDTMRSFSVQPDQMGVFHYVVDCLDFMMI